MNYFEQLEILENPNRMVQAVLHIIAEAGVDIQNEKNVAEIIRYDQKTIAALTSVNFFTGTYAASATNMVGSYIPNQSEHMVIFGIRILTGTDANVDQTVWDAGAFGIAGALNSEWTININGENELVNYPSSAALSALTTKDDGMISLNQPLFWPAQSELSIKNTLSVVGGANTNMRFELHGMGLIA